jgi:hypothetical protein
MEISQSENRAYTNAFLGAFKTNIEHPENNLYWSALSA